MTKAFLLGDSLMVGASPYIKKVFPSWKFIEYSKVGISSEDALKIAEGYQLNNQDFIFVSLGTNNWWTQYDLLVKCVNDLRKLAGIKPVIIWSTIHRPINKEDGYYEKFNSYLRTRREVNFSVADWKALIVLNPKFLASDKIHATKLGYQARARLYTDQVFKFNITS